MSKNNIDPESKEVLEKLLKDYPERFDSDIPITKRREIFIEYQKEIASDTPNDPRIIIEDKKFTHDNTVLNFRVYKPSTCEGFLPGIIYIHGGGMIFGDLDSSNDACKKLVIELGCIVVSLDYRKAPEYPYPHGLKDCYEGTKWVFAEAHNLGIQIDNIGMFGISAGGNLTISVALLSRDNNGPKLKYICPIYPMLDYRNISPSSKTITDIGVWDRKGNIKAWECYLNGKKPDQYASPILAQDLKNLPPTYSDVGTVDLFLDEDIEFFERLKSSGVETEFHVVEGAFHASEGLAPEAKLSKCIWKKRVTFIRHQLDS